MYTDLYTDLTLGEGVLSLLARNVDGAFAPASCFIALLPPAFAGKVQVITKITNGVIIITSSELNCLRITMAMVCIVQGTLQETVDAIIRINVYTVDPSLSKPLWPTVTKSSFG